MIRVVLADDHAMIRAGLTAIIAAEEEMTLVGAAESGDELIALLASTTVDVVVSDISMPGGGLDLVKRIAEAAPAARILILSMHPEEAYAARFIRAGAAGYIGKDAAPEELADAIRTVYGGGIHLAADLKDRLIAAARQAPTGLDLLSEREFEVLKRLAAGRTVSEIADDLRLSAKTVSTYRTRLMEKLNLKTTSELIRFALDHGVAERVGA